MTAALAIADQGFDVALVEKKGELGGNMRRLRFSTMGRDPQAFLQLPDRQGRVPRPDPGVQAGLRWSSTAASSATSRPW